MVVLKKPEANQPVLAGVADVPAALRRGVDRGTEPHGSFFSPPPHPLVAAPPKMVFSKKGSCFFFSRVTEQLSFGKVLYLRESPAIYICIYIRSFLFIFCLHSFGG